jgi:hypothetical protein
VTITSVVVVVFPGFKVAIILSLVVAVVDAVTVKLRHYSGNCSSM